MSDFFAMGGYGAFIWPCYGLAALVMIVLVVQSVRSMRVNEKLVETLRASRSHRRDQRGDSPAVGRAGKQDLEKEVGAGA